MQSATTMEQLRTLLGELEANLDPAWLCAGFSRDPLLAKNAFLPIGKEVAAIAPTGTVADMSLRPADQQPGAIDAQTSVQHSCLCFLSCLASSCAGTKLLFHLLATAYGSLPGFWHDFVCEQIQC
jgi:hypothetical protein